jgi:hypothetical protein
MRYIFVIFLQHEIASQFLTQIIQSKIKFKHEGTKNRKSDQDK